MANSGSNTNRKDTYFTGDNASGASEGHLWVDSTNNAIRVFRNGAWRTPTVSSGSFASPTFTGTANATDLTVASTTTTAALKVATGAARANGFVALGDGAVPTAPTSTSGFVQIGALPGTPVGQSAVPTTNTVFLSFDNTRKTLIVNAAGSWFAVPSLFIY